MKRNISGDLIDAHLMGQWQRACSRTQISSAFMGWLKTEASRKPMATPSGAGCAYYASRKRYPTPASVTINRGAVGSSASFWRR